jgi:hypothetical protein
VVDNAIVSAISIAPNPNAPPVLNVSHATLTFDAVVGTNPASQKVAISNGGGGILNWTATPDISTPAWLSVDTQNGTGSGTINVSANVANLAAGTYFKTITIAAQGASNAPLTVNVTLNIYPKSNVVAAINAGGGQYMDSSGNVFQSDTDYSGGYTYSTSSPISGTSDPTLYQSLRYGNFSYNIPLSNGNYSVTLKFVEPYWNSAGRRVFNVSMQGQQVITNLDVFGQAGGQNIAYDAPAVPVSVSNGVLNIVFTSLSDNAVVSAIEITPYSGIMPQPGNTSFFVNAGGGQYTDTAGNIYKADTGYSGGLTYSVSASTSISGTTDPALYQSLRYGDFSYNIPIANGNYKVTLKFAEIYWNSSGKRLFNVSMQGSQVISNLDVYAKAGGQNTTYDITIPVSVTNGVLNISFTTVADNAIVSAISVTPQ